MARTLKLKQLSVYVLLFLSLLEPTSIFGSLDEQNLTRHLLNSLDKALDFFEQDHKTINLDGIYGLRVAEGSLTKSLEDEQSGKLHIKKEYLELINKLQKKATSISEKALPFLRKANPTYFERFKKQVDSSWKEFKSFRNLDTSLYIPENKRDQISFDEETSDQCMSEMTGTGDVEKPCQLSAHCWQLMTATGTGGYALTHQGLFLLLGETQGCTKEINARLHQSNNGIPLQKVYARICASMYPQMTSVENPGPKVSTYNRDLYMEQAMVCAMMGYHEFLSKTRLKMILGWQRKDGCFSSDDDDRHVYDPNYRQGQVKRSMETMQPASRKLLSMRTMRSLLVEKALENGCMSHITGVATALLGVYVRWLLHHDNHHGSQLGANDTLDADLHPGRLAEHHMQRHIMGSDKQALAAVSGVDHSHVTPYAKATSTTVFVVLSLAVVGLVLTTRWILKTYHPFSFRNKKTAHVI